MNVRPHGPDNVDGAAGHDKVPDRNPPITYNDVLAGSPYEAEEDERLLPKILPSKRPQIPPTDRD
jgi:hypothetical protein